MNRESSPIFDVPDFPTLRRVKPLPRRLRMSEEGPTVGPADLWTDMSPPPMPPLEMPGPEATAEELLAHAEKLSAQMALQSYYMPILGGVQDLLRSSINGSLHAEIDENVEDIALPIDFGLANLAQEIIEDEGDDLPQPGNKKKRKVPANMGGSPRHHDQDAGSGGEEEFIDKVIPSRDDFNESTFPSSPPIRRGKLTPATLAGIQHKEMLKARKHQLGAVLGALSHGDTLALDQALSAHYPSLQKTIDGQPVDRPRVRLSRRRARRFSPRRMLTAPSSGITLPECEFTFTLASATADRLIATKEEVFALRDRFEAELNRQATKAAKLAAASKNASSLPAGRPANGRSRKRDRARPSGNVGRNDGHQNAEFLDPNYQPPPPNANGSALSVKPRGKKKKRSALANASNPHHLRNYVPSRLPHANASRDAQSVSNELGPLPLRFLNADLPPRRNKAQSAANPNLNQGVDEWICAYCEYELFFGDEHDFRRAIRNRKKILKRRRRARERAAAAASGKGRVNGVGEPRNEGLDDEDDYDAEYDDGDDSAFDGGGKGAWREDNSSVNSIGAFG